MNDVRDRSAVVAPEKDASANKPDASRHEPFRCRVRLFGPNTVNTFGLLRANHVLACPGWQSANVCEPACLDKLENCKLKKA